MSIGFCVGGGIIMGALVMLVGVMIADLASEIAGAIVGIIGIAMVLVGLICCCAYGLAEEKIEKTLHVPVSTINNVQIIQYYSPITGIPIIINVNDTFDRSFCDGECIAVTVYIEGPYNGIYGRPSCSVDVCEDPMCQPPTFIPPPLHRRDRKGRGLPCVLGC
jgi:hypothetical protein